MGEIKGVLADTVLKEIFIPKFCKARPVPYSLRNEVEKEIEELINEGVASLVVNGQVLWLFGNLMLFVFILITK